MNTYDEAEVEKKIASLPEDIRARITDDAVGLKLRAIGTQYGLLLDQITSLMFETRLVMLGIISNETFMSDLQMQFKMPAATIQAIAHDIETEITAPIIKAMQTHGSEQEDKPAMSDEQIAAIVAQGEAEKQEQDLFKEEIDKEDEKAFKEMMEAARRTDAQSQPDKTHTAKPVSPRATAEEIQRGLTGEKLAGNFKIPGEEKDYSVNKSSDQSMKQIPVIRHRDRVDPYHEPIE